MKTTKKRNLVLLITAVAFIVGTAITAYAEEPAVKVPNVSIVMKCPQCALFGTTLRDGKMEITLAEVLKVHGFCALGGSFQFRAAKEGLKLLYGNELPVRHNIKVETSHACCQAAALAYITGASGKEYGAFHTRNKLIILPPEEKKIVFTDIPSGKSVTLRPLFNPHHTMEPLLKKAFKDHSFAPEVTKVMNEKIHEYLTAPIEKLFIVEK